MIVTRQVCSLCGRAISPNGCDGRAYIPDYVTREGARFERPICRGTDRESFVWDNGVLKFRVVVGHGDVSVVPLIYRSDL